MQIKVFNIRLEKEYFEKDQEKMNSFLKTVNYKKSSSKIIEGKVNFWTVLVHYEEIEGNYIEEIEEKEIVNNESELSEYEKEIVAYFKQWRLDMSKEEMLPAYMILTNKTIISLAKIRPTKIEELDKIHGIGEAKKEKYGDSIIALLNSI